MHSSWLAVRGVPGVRGRVEKGCFDRLSRDVPFPGARNPTFSPVPALPKVFLRRPRRPFPESSVSVHGLCATELAAAPPGGRSNWRYGRDFSKIMLACGRAGLPRILKQNCILKGFQISYFPEIFSCPVVTGSTAADAATSGSLHRKQGGWRRARARWERALKKPKKPRAARAIK